MSQLYTASPSRNFLVSVIRLWQIYPYYYKKYEETENKNTSSVTSMLSVRNRAVSIVLGKGVTQRLR